MSTLQECLVESGFTGDSHSVKLVCRYLFRMTNQKTLRKQLGPGDFTRFSQRLTRDGYVIKHLKLWLYWCVKNGGHSSAKTRKLFGVFDKDAKIARLVKLDRQLTFFLMRRKAPPMLLTDMDTYVMWAQDQSKDWTGRFINRKMAFLQRNAYKLKFFDLFSELSIAAIRSIYLMYPNFDSADHLLAVYKRTVHNSGINLIQSHTASKRAQLQSTGNGNFESTTVNIDSTFAESQIKHALADDHQDSAQFRHFLGACSLAQQRLILILAGEVDDEFQSWLRETRKIASFTDASVLERAALFAESTRVPVYKVYNFVNRLSQFYSA